MCHQFTNVSVTDACTPNDSDSDDSGKKAAIIGAVVGAGALAGMLAAVGAWMYRRRKKKQQEEQAAEESAEGNPNNSEPQLRVRRNCQSQACQNHAE
jgi:hypothetical protein